MLSIQFFVTYHDEFHITLDTFWSKYNGFRNKNDHFDSAEFNWVSKGISGSNIHLCYQKCSLPYTKVISFVSRRVISKILRIGSD